MKTWRSGLVVISLIALPGGTWSQAGNVGDWMQAAPLPTPRQEMPLATLDGKIYVLGGILTDRTGTNLVEIYDPSSNSWMSGPNLPENIHHLGAVVAEGRLFIVGGYLNNGFSPSERVYELEPSVDLWISKSSMPGPRGAHATVACQGKIYALGGTDRAGRAVRTNEVYDPASDIWQTLSPMPSPREHLAAAVIDTLIYVIGGRYPQGGQLTNVSTLEAYSPATDTWHELTPMPTPRGGLAAAAMNDFLYVLGGEFFFGSTGVYAENEEYDPLSDSWRQVAPLPTPRHGMSAVVHDDQLYVIGGGPVAGYGVIGANEVFAFEPLTYVAEEEVAFQPALFTLHQNYPNPFNPHTTIPFDLAIAAHVTLTIYDASGLEMATLVNAHLAAGSHQVSWDAAAWPSGTYFCELHVDGGAGRQFAARRKLILMR